MPTSSSKALRAAPLLALAVLLCANDRPSYAPTIVDSVPPPPADGAIFHADQGYAPLTSGTRAASVGDIVSIVLVERTQAAKTNSAVTAHDGSIGLAPPITGPLSLFTPSDINMGGDTSFNGKGQATQSNTLSGEISVTIAEVYPNGTMLVRGEKRLKLNRGEEFIQISGLIRSSDIGPDNRIASTRVADARITYSGNGEIARASRQGWLQRFFTMLSPF